jgi:hypothetical protein
MPTYLDGITPDLPKLPLIEAFSGLKQEGFTSGSKLVGKLSSLADIDAIVPRPNHRVELEYCEGDEEIRVVNNITGEFHQATGDTAKALLAEMKARQAVDLAGDGSYPAEYRRISKIDQLFIQYDKQGRRIWPALRRAGICHTKEGFLSHANGDVYWDEWHEGVDEGEDFIAIVDTTTGEFWITDAETTKQMREGRRKKREEHMGEHREKVKQGEEADST